MLKVLSYNFCFSSAQSFRWKQQSNEELVNEKPVFPNPSIKIALNISLFDITQKGTLPASCF